MTQPNPAEMYESYLVPALFTPWTNVLVELVAPRRGDRVLDLACGTGVVARRLAELVGAEAVTGLDVNPQMLGVARARAPDIAYVEGSAVALDLPDGRFDRVICQQGFQFFPDRAAAAREVRRVLAPGGRAAIAVWRGLDVHPVFRALFEAEGRFLGVAGEELATPFSLGDRDALRALVAGGGFAEVDVTERTMDVFFPNPDQFVAMVAGAAAAVMPDFASVDVPAMVAAVRAEVADVIEQNRDGDRLRVSTTTHLVVART
jgi:SAM-dependent methyltransferase